MSSFRSEWTAQGYFVVPQLFDAQVIEKLKVICDDVFQMWLAESLDPQEAANQTNMAYLTELRYFERQPERLKMLLEVIAHEKITNIFRQTFDAEPLFHNTQYFFEPASVTRSGVWHRDQQFGAPDVEAEKAVMSQKGFHAHIALVPDDNLEIVPGTHARWDTPQEFEIRKGFFEQARIAFEEVLRRNPLHSKAQNNLGQVYEAQNDQARAIQAYRRAIELDRNSAKPSELPFLNLAALLSENGQLEEALPLLARAALINQTSPKVRFQLGKILQRLGRLTEAEKELVAATKLDPSDPGPRYVLGQLYRKLGKTELARQELEISERLRSGKKL